ncbi:MAG: AraC family transcriptional regulator [Deltaproteobacteria bacterium]|nr:MAG: AraC family transcriptional regulator [Deltaproteobacteria bacterium]TMQ17715.1 MAG: AraC family transcriptional regulator [Deltaproteobacteria bacterium]
MTPGPTVGVSHAKGLIEFAVSRGASLDELCERSQTSIEELADLDGRIPLGRYQAVMTASIELTGDPALALHYGEALERSALSVIGLIEVDGVAPGARFQIARDHGGTWIVDARTNPNSFPELIEVGFARVVCGARKLGSSGKPFATRVHVTHPAPTHHAEYERVLGLPTVFASDRNAILMADDWMSDRATTTRCRVENLLIPILHTTEPCIERIARKLGVSRQTLYRRLKAEHVSYERVLDELRHRMALHYLNARNASVNETAYLVGFSEPSAFSRAFKRWTGTSPRKRAP